MLKLIFSREGKNLNLYVDDEKDKEGLEGLARREFGTLQEFSDEIKKYHCRVNRDLRIIDKFIGPKIEELPFTLKKLPIFYFDPQVRYRDDGRYIGNVEEAE